MITDQHIAVAQALADAARSITLKNFRSLLTVESKDDRSPVTAADREAEQVMRRMIREHFPEHGISGEEGGDEGGNRGFWWSLDPIDGTRSFATGQPTFGTLIALLYDERPLLGIIDMPRLDERWVGVHEGGATLNGQPCRTGACDTLGNATLLATSPDMFNDEQRRRFDALGAAVFFRTFGTDCYGYGLLASGLADIVMEADLAPYDLLALVPVVKEAGGCITDWQGQSPGSNDGKRQTVLASANPALHQKALTIIAAS